MILEAKSENMMADVVYLDFRKAFDSVPHSKLLSILKSYGINGTLWRWFDAYLNNRTQYVCISLLHQEKKSYYSNLDGIVAGQIFCYYTLLMKCLV